MSGQLRAAHRAHAQCGKRKQAHFYGIGAADRQAKPPQFTQVRDIKPG